MKTNRSNLIVAGHAATRSLRTLATTGMTLALGLGGTALPAMAGESLLKNVNAEVPSHFKFGPKITPGRNRTVQVQLDRIDHDTLTLPLLDDTEVTLVRDRVEQGKGKTLVWVGHIDGEPESEVILVVRGQAMMGTVRRGDDAYEIVYAGNRVHVLRQIDLNATAPHIDPIPVPVAEMAAAAEDGNAQTPPASGAATGTEIDLMVVYTPKARANAGGTEAIEAKILNAVAATNQAYLNSQINMHLNVVHMAEVNYTETGDMRTSIADLAGTSDGKMDNVHALRDQYGADQVTLVSADSNYCGIAYQMQSLSTSFAPWAFSVVHDDSRYNCLGGNHTLGHELGHNQGNSHNVEDSGGYAGITPYSYGYRECGAFHTVMSYRCNEPVIPHFANPDITYNGLPTGVVDAADTAKSMNLAAATVANFRTASATSVPAAPDNLSAAAVSESRIDLTWSDNSGDETGFRVQRSQDGVTWIEIASLLSNSTGFTDSGLNPATTYSYRVYAYNSVGDSGFSNVATATTRTVTADTTPPSVRISNPADGSRIGSKVNISASATDDVGVAGMKLYIDGRLVAATNGASLAYTWNTRKASTGLHTIRVDGTDAAGNTGSREILVSKDTTNTSSGGWKGRRKK